MCSCVTILKNSVSTTGLFISLRFAQNQKAEYCFREEEEKKIAKAEQEAQFINNSKVFLDAFIQMLNSRLQYLAEDNKH